MTHDTQDIVRRHLLPPNSPPHPHPVLGRVPGLQCNDLQENADGKNNSERDGAYAQEYQVNNSEYVLLVDSELRSIGRYAGDEFDGNGLTARNVRQ